MTGLTGLLSSLFASPASVKKSAPTLPKYDPDLGIKNDLAQMRQLSGGDPQVMQQFYQQRAKEVTGLQLGLRPEEVTDAIIDEQLRRDFEDPKIRQALLNAFEKVGEGKRTLAQA